MRTETQNLPMIENEDKARRLRFTEYIRYGIITASPSKYLQKQVSKQCKEKNVKIARILSYGIACLISNLDGYNSTMKTLKLKQLT